MGLSRILELLDTLGGTLPVPARWQAWRGYAIVRGLLWAVLFLAAYAFMGNDVKFVYVDF